jgi:hypothetical protein
MAVNHVDGTMFFSVVLYPFFAGKAALEAGAGWLTLLFIPPAIFIGIGINYTGRKLIYALMEPIVQQEDKFSKGILAWIIEYPAFLLYIILPYAIVAIGVLGTWCVTTWIVHHL